ncbi:MAG TPA: S8 family serine peptidase [Candidatus Baltobacteraceae bacterium]|nr:S8 family serine peptidase [Candidatus Baltobacteraceae bacterium]
MNLFKANPVAVTLFIAVYIFSAILTTPGVVSAADSPTGHVAYKFDLPDGRHGEVLTNGIASVYSKDNRQVEVRAYASGSRFEVGNPAASWLPDKAQLATDFARKSQMPFIPGRVILVLRPGATMVQAKGLLSRIRVEHTERLFQRFNGATLAAMRHSTESRLQRPLLSFENAYLLHVKGRPVRKAVSELLRSPLVAYASPDWRVTSLRSVSIPLPSADQKASQSNAFRPTRTIRGTSTESTLPGNYALSSSAQSLLNAPALDDAAAYDEVEREFHQLPGQGETITNVSIGDLDDAAAANNQNDPCSGWVQYYGPTTEVVGAQRYINWPSMPLIPTYTADTNGNLNGSGEVCGIDPQLQEVGLDFSMMAPLPNSAQRMGEQGSAYTDLLGIAPGANYRLVVPASSAPALSDIDAAFLAAAQQEPHPDVITASLGIGVDSVGFPSRYVEDDPLTESIIASIVGNEHITVCISGGDGTRMFTNAAIGPSGGSAPTNVAFARETATSINDIALSTVPSYDYDSGAIDVGGSTLDDIFSSPPQYASGGAAAAEHAYPETRWTGFTAFSSGFGSRVNVSAPSDNVLSLYHVARWGAQPDSVGVALGGGTSASAPEAAAAAAVALQVARLSGHPFQTALDVRKFLEQTATPITNVSQADVQLNVGPQLNLRNAVETLLREAGMPVKPSVARVAVEQRRNVGFLDGAFITGTDPTNIDLKGSSAGADRSDADEDAWITIAPDWEGMPAGATYRLSVDTSGMSGAARVSNVQSLRQTGNSVRRLQSEGANVLATTPWARLLPARILQAAGIPLESSSSRTVQLTYQAQTGAHVLTSVTFALTFGPADATTTAALAPQVPSVVTGSTIPVTYDLSDVRNLSNPTLVVSEPGRVDPATGLIFRPSYTAALTAAKGTVNVPVSALQGGGIYGIGVQTGPGAYSDFAFTRLAAGAADRPAAPILSVAGTLPGHVAEIPFGGSFNAAWNVATVKGATGAILEIADGGPNLMLSLNTFNNPNGSLRDNNGIDGGSVYYAPVGGVAGSLTLTSSEAHLTDAGAFYTVRVVPTHGGIPIGEASDVSTVAVDGVPTPDGGQVAFGFNINTAGSDGFLTSSFGSGPASISSFDQRTNSLTSTIAGLSDISTWGRGISNSDLTAYCSVDNFTYVSNCTVFGPISSGSIGPSWAPADGTVMEDGIIEPNSDTAEVLLHNYFSDTQIYGLMPWNLATNTPGQVIDLSGPINTMPCFFHAPYYLIMGADPAAGNIDLVLANTFCLGPATVVEVNPQSGTITSFTPKVPGFGLPHAASLDPITHRGTAITDFSQTLTIYDLANKAPVISEYVPGNLPFSAAADPQKSHFLVLEFAGTDFGLNNNAKSPMLIYDENGNLVATREDYSLAGAILDLSFSEIHLNPTTRIGYTIGPFGNQLQPFSY